MTYDSLSGIEKSLILRETLNSEQDTRKNGGVPTNLTYSNGEGVFDGTAYVNIDPILTSLKHTTKGTWSVKFKMNSFNALGERFISFADTNAIGFLELSLSSDLQEIQASARIGNFTYWDIESDVRISLNKWYSVVVVHNGVAPVLYIDGLLASSHSTGSDYTVWFSDMSPELDNGRIGNMNFFNLGESYFIDGNIDIVEIYNTAKTAEEVKNWYDKDTYREVPAQTSSHQEVLNIQNTQGVISDKYNHAIVNTDTTIKKDGEPYVMDLDGSAFLNIDSTLSDLSTSTTGTWMAWVKPFDATPSATNMIMTFNDTSADEYIDLWISTGGLLRVDAKKAGTYQFTLDTDSTVFTSGVWTHVALVQNGTEPVLYVNGVKVAQAIATTTDKTAWFNDLTNIDNGRVGNIRFNGGAEALFFNGKMSQPKIYTGGFSAEEIMQVVTNEQRFYLK